MLGVTLQPNYGIAILEPDGPLTADDFVHAASIIDAYITRTGALKGLLIATESFPGWASFSALVSHMKFMKNHHAYINKVAIVTHSALGSFASMLTGHFVRAEIKLFAFDDIESAKYWLLEL